MLTRKILSNGLETYLKPVSGTEAVCAVVFVRVGSRYETRRTSGIAHFVEHLMFKGTKRRPRTEMIARELDGVGAEYNAFTTKDHTGYYIKLAREHLPRALDIISDMLTGSLLKVEEIERERGVILEEVKMYEENPLMHIGDLAEQVMYGDTPLGWCVAGTRDSVNSITRNNIMKFVGSAYRAPAMTLAIAGAIEVAETQKLVSKWFKGMKKGNGTFPQFVPYRARISKAPSVAIDRRDTTQVHIALSTDGVPYLDRRIEAHQLLSVILGGNMSSRLFTEVRERRGLAYYVRAEHGAYHDTGSFSVRCGVDQGKIEEALKTITRELKKISTARVPAGELKRAKEFLHGKMTLDLEDSAEVAEWYGRQAILTGRIQTPHEKLAKLDKVSASEIQSVARVIFQRPKFRLAVIGPYETPEPFLKILSAY